MNSFEMMDVRLQKNENHETHFHPDVELYFVVKGALTVTIKDSSWRIPKDQFILINSGLAHSVKSESPDTVSCCAVFSCRSIAEMAGEESSLFYCNSTVENDPKYHEMRRIFHELVYTQVQRPHKTPCLKQSVLYKLLDCLLEYFQLDLGNASVIPADDVKIMQIFQYINQNYAYNVSLTELADHMYMSKSALSRFFKKQTGVYFADYLNQIRLNYALEDLIYSNKNITKIAMDSGFSNPSAFNKIFREQYGVSPSEYRAQAGQQTRRDKPELKEEDEQLNQELKSILMQEENAAPDFVSIRANMTGGVPFPKIWSQCINIGSAYNLTVANLQYHTLYLQEHLGFSYVRIWSVFSQKLTVSDGKTKGYYNYDRLDMVFDFLVSNHIRPVIDFGRRPDTATYEPGNPVFCDEEYIPFASRAIWEDLFRDFILHITNRYGETETSRWIFEFSFDTSHAPDRDYYAEDQFDYFEVFSYAYQTIKRFLPGAKVGGPMAEAEPDYTFVVDFLRACREQNCLPDFVSFMLFPYRTSSWENEKVTERASSDRTEREQVELMQQILQEANVPDCPIYITEWNDTLSNRNYLNDSCSRASYIIKKISEIADKVALISLWMASDWMSSYFDTVCITNGGSGILTKDTIRKPAYFALDFLNRLGTSLLDQGANYLITEKNNGEYYILCYNYKWFSLNYFLREESIRDPEQLRDIFEDSHLLELEFRLENLPVETEFIVKIRTINEEHGSLLTEWKNFQYDRKLRSTDIKYIRESCIPKVRMERQVAKEGKLRLRVKLQPHEITLLHIYEEP